MKTTKTIAMVLAGLMLSGMTAMAQTKTETEAAAAQAGQAATAAQEATKETAAETVEQAGQQVEAAEKATESVAAPLAEEESGATVWAAKAAKVLEMQKASAPDKRIPEAITEQAQCVAVFPSVIKAAFVVGAKRGDGLVTCRDEDAGGWGAPAFFRMKGVSWGMQIGAQSADVILMIMNEEGVDGLLKAKVSLGGDVGVTAGPVGRNASVSMDLLLKSPMISYARSKGVFAGLNLEGSTIIFNKEANEKLYGAELDPSAILFETTAVPEELQSFQTALTEWAPPLK